MSSTARDVLSMLLLLGLVLGLGMAVGLVVWLAVRVESFRFRRGFAHITKALSAHRSTPASIGPAWSLENHEGDRAGYRVRTAYGLGGRVVPGGSGRGLHVRVEVERTDAARLEDLGPALPEPARTVWSEPDRVRVEPQRRTASFTLSPPTSARDAERFWQGVRAAAERLEALPVEARAPDVDAGGRR